MPFDARSKSPAPVAARIRNMSEPRTEGPSWAKGSPELRFAGFTLRGEDRPPALACTQQAHADGVHWVEGEPSPPSGDALWTATGGLLVAVRVADCVPILLWDPQASAVAAVHAGWRGTALDIAGVAVAAGAARGVDPRRLWAAIGPSIGPCCFEVGDEVVAELVAAGLSRDDMGFELGPRGRPHLDLRRANRVLLRRAGLHDDRIEDVGGCTHCNPDRYESYRRDGTTSGRMRGVIGLAHTAFCLLVLLLGFPLLGAGCSASPQEDSYDLPEAADRAQALIEADKAEEAVKLAQGLVETDPQDAHLRGVLARALHRCKRFPEALAEGKRAAELDPALWHVAYNLAATAAALGQTDEALGWLQRAIGGGVTPEEIAQDPDFQSLLNDHRMAVFLATGFLTLDEEDAVAVIRPSEVRVGEPVRLTVALLSLNRELLSRREPVTVQLRRILPEGFLLPIQRLETFTTGDAGGREYAQRNLSFDFTPLVPGRHYLGPFEVRHGDRRTMTDIPVLDVRPSDTALSVDPTKTVVAQADFFGTPSVEDPALFEALKRAGGLPVQLDPLAKMEVSAPWTTLGPLSRRAFRYRATEVDRLPSSVPDLEPTVFRSVLVQRGTEGWSHVVETRRMTSHEPVAPEGVPR